MKVEDSIPPKCPCINLLGVLHICGALTRNRSKLVTGSESCHCGATILFIFATSRWGMWNLVDLLNFMQLRGRSPLWVLLSLVLCFQCSSSVVETITKGSYLSVENPDDVMVSPNGLFSAGFYAVGENAYCFAIWFTEPNGQKGTVVWMANRDQPVNGKRSTLALLNTGNLVIVDAGQSNIWDTSTSSMSSLHLFLYDTGNLVLRESNDAVLWQSFDFPTNTLLPQQVFTRYRNLVSSRGASNHSSGFYQLFFDNENVLRLLYNGPDVSSVYWPDPWLLSWAAQRTTYNSTRVAVLDSLGNFTASDDFNFTTSDYGMKIQRRLTIDYDGNLRVYSRRNGGEKWYVSWQVKSRPCKIHGVCGANSLCTFNHISGGKCSCLPGYEVNIVGDWSYGCKPKFDFACNKTNSRFLRISNVELYGYDYASYGNYTYKQCEDLCLQLCICKGFQYSYNKDTGLFTCYPKSKLLNGYRVSYFAGDLYVRLPASSSFTYEESFQEYKNLVCSTNLETVQVERTYEKEHENGTVKFMLWFACGIGGLEIVCIFLVWRFLIRTRKKSGADTEGYISTATGFKKFSYSELKEATKDFSLEIGRGAAGIVYKGVLLDSRVAAIKRLREATQGEEEFLAEVWTIGRLNHMNLTEIWGYCAEGKHRLLVYEYMEHGSLAENIRSNGLDWTKRFNIALGTAKGLAYLHEECLEWILHCDVKPQNILLDSNYQPKVSDFGLVKLLNRNDLKHSSFSRIRGTRGYMAPEWVFNLPITSKVDVYSYGIVVLEMITGKSVTMDVQTMDEVDMQQQRLVTWVREKQKKGSPMTTWVDEIVEPAIEGDYDLIEMEVLARVALQCVEEERGKRPTMSQVVEMLQSSSLRNED